MQILEKELYTKTNIRFNDCDPFQHLNNSKYIDYFLNIREEQLDKFYDFSVYKLGLQGISWVVNQNLVSYLRPAKYGEIVTVKTSLIDFSEFHLLVEMEMLNHDSTELKAVLWTKFAHIDLLNGRKKSHSKELLEFFEKVVIIFEENNKPLNYESRVSELVKGYKLK